MFTVPAEKEKGESILQNTPFQGDFQAYYNNDKIIVTFDIEADLFEFVRLVKEG